jgi:hypothetical protein
MNYTTSDFIPKELRDILINVNISSPVKDNMDALLRFTVLFWGIWGSSLD